MFLSEEASGLYYSEVSEVEAVKAPVKIDDDHYKWKNKTGKGKA